MSEQANPEGAVWELMDEAERLEAGGAQPKAAAPAQDAPDTAGELLQALVMARMIVAPMFEWWPKFAEVWSDPQLTQISVAGAAVMERHGITMGEALSQFGPYIALGGATLPPCLVTWAAIKAERDAPPPMPPAPAPGSA